MIRFGLFDAELIEAEMFLRSMGMRSLLITTAQEAVLFPPLFPFAVSKQGVAGLASEDAKRKGDTAHCKRRCTHGSENKQQRLKKDCS